MNARGEALRADDDPDVLRKRLLAYRAQTAPLTAYYGSRSVLRSVDGMATVAEWNRRSPPRCRTAGKLPARSLSAARGTGLG